MESEGTEMRTVVSIGDGRLAEEGHQGDLGKVSRQGVHGRLSGKNTVLLAMLLLHLLAFDIGMLLHLFKRFSHRILLIHSYVRSTLHFFALFVNDEATPPPPPSTETASCFSAPYADIG